MKQLKTFICDLCTKVSNLKDKCKVYDENYNLQKGIYCCKKCNKN